MQMEKTLEKTAIYPDTIMRRILPYIAYPGMTIGAVIFSLWAVASGWPLWLIGGTAFFVAIVFVDLLERYIPYSKVWREPKNDQRADLFHFLVSNRAFDVGTLVAMVLCAPIAAVISSKAGGTLWPHHWPLLSQALLATIIFELPWYWVHRLGHTWMPLWRLHVVHHSSRRIYWWNFSRNHPLDNLISAFFSFAPLVVMGIGQEPLAVMAAFSAGHGLLQHSNVDLRTGILDYFFSTARVHRWHHSPLRHESDANYSPRLLLWDHVFGSYRFRAHEQPRLDVGLGSGHPLLPDSFSGQMLIPFKSEFWKKNK